MNRGCRILIVEDRVDWQQMLSEILRREGYEVKQAFYHGEALSLIAREHFDLAIVDLRLEGSVRQERYEGEEILESLRAQGVFTVVVTAYTTPETDRRLLNDYGKFGVYTIVDKVRFEETDFGRRGFPSLVREALVEAERARRADGLAEDQLERLQRGPGEPDGAR
jgi:CheY-like chemotaxis protein